MSTTPTCVTPNPATPSSGLTAWEREAYSPSSFGLGGDGVVVVAFTIVVAIVAVGGVVVASGCSGLARGCVNILEQHPHQTQRLGQQMFLRDDTCEYIYRYRYEKNRQKTTGELNR